MGWATAPGGVPGACALSVKDTGKYARNRVPVKLASPAVTASSGPARLRRALPMMRAEPANQGVHLSSLRRRCPAARPSPNRGRPR